MLAAINLACLWVGIGLFLTRNTLSRGLWADCLFVLLWPVHVIAYLMGRD